MAKTLRASFALFLALALVLLSPGLEAPRLFAQVVVRTAPVGIAPMAGFSAASPLAAPSIFAPAALGVAPALAAPAAFAAAPALTPAAPAARAASVPEMALALAPHIEAAAKADTSASGAAAAGRGIEAVITGQRSAGSGDISAVAGVEGSGAPSLGFGAAASAPVEAAKAAVSAAAALSAPAVPKTVDSAASYGFHRFLLKTVAKLTGGVYSLPVAGPELTRKLIGSAADKSVVFSDYDATLAEYSQVLPESMVAAVEAIKAAGKTFVVISDRGDEPRKNQLTVFESLASLPVATRAGMYVAANSGGRVYRYDDKGEPVRVFEAPAPDAAEKAKLTEAVDATKARLKDIGAELHYPSETNKVPTESWNVYSYAMMLKIGSDDAHVRGAADILTEEMAKRGYNVQVDPRYAKDPTNPPYVVFSLVTKQTASAFIAKALKARAEDILVIGDSMYTPGVPKKESWLTKLGVKLSGLALPRTGNRTDRNMELAVPGALMFSVGASGDPRASNLFVLADRGPSVTLQVLRSVASRKIGEKSVGARDLIAPALILAAAGASYYFLIHGLTGLLAQWESTIRSAPVDGAVPMFGGILGAAAVNYAAGGRELLSNPGITYAEALKQATAAAAARGVPASEVRFVEATASMPVTDGAHWKYTFAIPGNTIIYVDMGRHLSSGLEARTSVYTGGPEKSGFSSDFAPFWANARLDPQAALGRARMSPAGLGAGVSVALAYRDDQNLWYRFYGDNGAVVSVNARTEAVQVDQAVAAKAAPKVNGIDRWAGVKAAAVGVGFLAAIAASFYFMGHALIDWLGQAEQQLHQAAPEFIGGTLGIAGLAGTIRAAKLKVGDDEINAAAKAVIFYKGGTWSQSEYDGGYFNAANDLRKRGATKEQMERFRKLCGDAPVAGGRFNPWAGD